jgi:hypothetical protein
MNKATMRAARRNYAILHNGPSGPARQVECKTAFRIIARNENEYARARARVRGSLEYFEPFGHTRYVTSREVLFEYRKCFFTLVSSRGPRHVPNGTGTKPKAWKKKKKKNNGKSNNAISARLSSRSPRRSYAADRFLYNQRFGFFSIANRCIGDQSTGPINRPRKREIETGVALIFAPRR